MYSDEEKQAVEEMRKVPGYSESLIPQETIVRFLRARDHDMKKTKAMLDNHRKLTAMLNFRTFGCKIGEDSLKARLKMAEKKSFYTFFSPSFPDRETKCERMRKLSLI